LTRAAAGPLADIHPREPVTLKRNAEQLWLDCRHVDRVNSATDMSPDIQRPRPAPEPPAQGRLAF